MKKVFWLHIKKSAGTSIRRALGNLYTRTDHFSQPKNFIMASPDEYNDILNNYRVVLGEYQFRRSLFAKTYLYPDDWQDHFSFAICREPIERCVSMFEYLYQKRNSKIDNALFGLSRTLKTGTNHFSRKRAFDAFLDVLQASQASDSIYQPLSLHFQTHTAPMWPDITDNEGNILLTRVYRMENLEQALDDAHEAAGIKRESRKSPRLNPTRLSYQPTSHQLQRIQKLFMQDLDLYESLANIG